MKRFLSYDNINGNITGFYFEGSAMPEGCIEITEEEHNLYHGKIGYKVNLETIEVEFIAPILSEIMPTEVELLQEQIASMQEALDFMIMNY